MSGINAISCHHPLFPISCNLLAPTAIYGISTANEYIPLNNPVPLGLNVPNIASNIVKTILTIVLKSTKYQYSALCALPVKVAYFFNTPKYQFILLTP